MNFYLLQDVFDKSNVIKYLYLSIVYNFHYRYEQNRGKRRFLEGWKTGRPWLNISEDSMPVPGVLMSTAKAKGIIAGPQLK